MIRSLALIVSVGVALSACKKTQGPDVAFLLSTLQEERYQKDVKYFETHAKRVGIPPAIYSWTITGIWRPTGPYVLDTDTMTYVRDPNRPGFQSTDQTNADRDPVDSYLLRCRLEADAPTHEL